MVETKDGRRARLGDCPLLRWRGMDARVERQLHVLEGLLARTEFIYL